MHRQSQKSRKTTETNINIKINLDGTGVSNINTGIGFFDHMLVLFSKHGFFDLELNCIGDLHIDDHHTIEDVAIVLGQCIKEALGTKEKIKRYGSTIIPMDETLVLCAIDISGRPYLNFDVKFNDNRIGNMSTEMIEEFFKSLSYNIGMNIHIKALDGKNSHHLAECAFKSFARALKEACTIDDKIVGVLSSKGQFD